MTLLSGVNCLPSLGGSLPRIGVSLFHTIYITLMFWKVMTLPPQIINDDIENIDL